MFDQQTHTTDGRDKFLESARAAREERERERRINQAVTIIQVGFVFVYDDLHFLLFTFLKGTCTIISNPTSSD